MSIRWIFTIGSWFFCGSFYRNHCSTFLPMDSESIGSTISDTCSTCGSDTSIVGTFPVADGPLYRQRNNFYKKLRNQQNRRAFSARCSRTSPKENDTTYRICVLESTNETADCLTEEDIASLLCSQKVVVQRNTSFQRARTFRNPVRA